MNQKNIQGGTPSPSTKNEGIVDQAKQAVENVAGQAREQVTTQVAAQKDKAAGAIGGVADALRQTSGSMKQSGPLPAIADQAADTVDRIAEYLQSRNLGDLIGEVERFARREPAIFLGSAFAMGLLGGRFLKSSPQHQYGGEMDRFVYDEDYDREEPQRFQPRRMAPDLPPTGPRVSPSVERSVSGTTTKPMGTVTPPTTSTTGTTLPGTGAIGPSGSSGTGSSGGTSGRS